MFKLSKSKSPNLAKIHDGINDLLNTIPLVKRRRRRKRVFKFLKYAGLIILVILLLSGILFGTAIADSYKSLKYALAGKNDLETAIDLAQKKNFSESYNYSIQAEEDLKIAFSYIEKSKGNFFISKIKFLNHQFEDIASLIKTAEILSRAFSQGMLFGKNLEDMPGLNYSKFSREEKRKIIKLIYESGPELNGLKANLDLAQISLTKVRPRGVLWLFREKLEKFKIGLSEGREMMALAVPMSEILPVLAGYPDKSSFLVLLQNSDELRPTGGFLGTYGILETDSGDIARFDTHDIYHMDMPVKDRLNVSPPVPIKKYLVDKWFMRDANWSPDWPTAAKKIEWFYQKEDALLLPKDQINDFKGEFNGVMAITPEFVHDLLAITGPIYVDGDEFIQDNFTQLLEYKVEKGYVQLGVPKWHRKEVIGRIFRKLKISLFDLPAKRWPEVMEALRQNTIEKNILVYFKDERLAGLAKDLNWAGELKDAKDDYLMVVDANLAALKTDAVMSRNINYSLEQDVNGVFAKLRINYKHNGGFDWRTTRYRTYTRIYVPLGSKLIRAEGFTDGEVRVGTELNKTYFGAFISIEPGEIGSLNFEYKLPDKLARQIKDSQKYELFFQKQPGNAVEELVVDFKAGNKVKAYNPTGFYVQDYGQGVRWETDLMADRVFSVEF